MRDKFIPSNELEVRLQSEPRPMVFTNGVFDILHRGHVTYLAQAKSLGAFLIVALNTDSSVKRLGKGVDRPINNTEDRIAVIEALESVDAVTSFAEDTPLNLIMRIKPDILVKGGDWVENQIVGSAEVKQWGGSTVSIPFQFDTSTSNTIERIREG